MDLKDLRSNRSLALMLTLFILTASSCSLTTDLVADKLDPRTSVTITYNQSPMILYRDVSGRAANARDYVDLGPIEVNRRGS